METGERRTIGEKVMRERKKKERETARQTKKDRQRDSDREIHRQKDRYIMQTERGSQTERKRERECGWNNGGREGIRQRGIVKKI